MMNLLNNHDYFVTIWTRMMKCKVPQFFKGRRLVVMKINKVKGWKPVVIDCLHLFVYCSFARLEILAALLLRIRAFWDEVPDIWKDLSAFIHIQGWRGVRTRMAFKGEGALETVGTTYALTQHHVPEGWNPVLQFYMSVCQQYSWPLQTGYWDFIKWLKSSGCCS